MRSKAPMLGWLARWRSRPNSETAAAEARAKRAEDRLSDAIEAIAEGVVFLDNDGRYLLWNQRYAEISHRSADLFTPGARLMDTLREGVRRGDYPDAIGREETWLAERAAMLEAGNGVRHEQRLADGRWLMIADRRTREGGVIGLRVDITAFKAQSEALAQALARAEAANRTRSEFLADMSHQLRTPLNGVLGLARVLAATDLDETQRALMDDLRASAVELDRLTRGLIDDDDRQSQTQPTPASAGGTAGLKVLVADDNPTNRKVIALMLTAAGVDAACVEDGRQAVDAWRAGGFDAILMDLRMPVMDGLEAIRTIRAEESAAGLRRALIVVLSANTSPADRAASAAAGADDHLGKPIDADTLISTLSAAPRYQAAQAG